MAMMYNPPHPGEMIREMRLAPLNLTVTAMASALGVSRNAMSELLNGKSGVSPEMAVRLSKAFDTTPEFWMGLQVNYDLWRVKKTAGKLKVKRLAA
ncbi:MAG: HigA family addiction module antidote protein [Nitrospinae bacterium]|nr:HigA family addiction module antidote protein [Nitrospinota bacterium]